MKTIKQQIMKKEDTIYCSLKTQSGEEKRIKNNLTASE